MTETDFQRVSILGRFRAYVRGSTSCLRKQAKKRQRDEDSTDDDVDCNQMENKMMRRLEKEKQNIKNWHKILMRVQMINAFKLSLRSEDQIVEDEQGEVS